MKPGVSRLVTVDVNQAAELAGHNPFIQLQLVALTSAIRVFFINGLL